MSTVSSVHFTFFKKNIDIDENYTLLCMIGPLHYLGWVWCGWVESWVGWFNLINLMLHIGICLIVASKFPQVAVDLDCKEQDVLNIWNFIHKTCKCPHLKTPLTSVKRKLTFYDLKCEFYRCCGGGVVSSSAVLCRHKHQHSQHTVSLTLQTGHRSNDQQTDLYCHPLSYNSN